LFVPAVVQFESWSVSQQNHGDPIDIAGSGLHHIVLADHDQVSTLQTQAKFGEQPDCNI